MSGAMWLICPVSSKTITHTLIVLVTPHVKLLRSNHRAQSNALQMPAARNLVVLVVDVR